MVKNSVLSEHTNINSQSEVLSLKEILLITIITVFAMGAKMDNNR